MNLWQSYDLKTIDGIAPCSLLSVTLIEQSTINQAKWFRAKQSDSSACLKTFRESTLDTDFGVLTFPSAMDESKIATVLSISFRDLVYGIASGLKENTALTSDAIHFNAIGHGRSKHGVVLDSEGPIEYVTSTVP